MSMSVQIKVSETVTRTVHVEDGVSSQLSILSVTSEEETTSLLSEAVSSRGFVKDDDGVFRRVDDGVTTEIDVSTREVRIKIASKKEVKRTASDTTWGYDDAPDFNQDKVELAKQDLRSQLDREVVGDESALRQEVTKKLEKALPALRDELDGVVNEVVKKALRLKAGRMGQVLEVSEDDDGNMTIKVAV